MKASMSAPPNNNHPQQFPFPILPVFAPALRKRRLLNKSESI